MKFHLLALLLVFCVALHGQEPPVVARPKPRTVEELAAQTVVIFNENDLDSVALAGQYAEARKIPVKNLVGLKCSVAEEIAREDYDRTIAEPLRKIFVERGWWTLREKELESGRVEKTSIRFAVLIRGIPLKIAQTPSYQGDETEGQPPEIFLRNDAAVDSELSVLGLWSTQISGPKENPYYREDKVIGDTDFYSQLLVCRLDAATAETVRTMIDDSIEVEKEGLRGFVYVDMLGLKSGQLMIGDGWLQAAAANARENGLPVILDNGPALFPAAYPMRHCAMYLGWYNETVMGPFANAGFRLNRGAIGYHIHSFSASSLRDPHKYWCAPLLAAGAAATLGNVYEPFLGLLPRPDVLEQRLREGFTFAEAAYMSQQYLSWMTTFIGDPLYRPFANSAQAKPKAGNEWDAYRDGVSLWLAKGRATGEASLRETAARTKSGIVSECLGLLQLSGGANAAAIAAFEQARGYYNDSADRVRVAVHEAGAIRALKGVDAAVSFLKAQANANPGPHADALAFLAQSIAAPPAEDPKPGPRKPAVPPKEPKPAKKPEKKTSHIQKQTPNIQCLWVRSRPARNEEVDGFSKRFLFPGRAHRALAHWTLDVGRWTLGVSASV